MFSFPSLGKEVVFFNCPKGKRFSLSSSWEEWEIGLRFFRAMNAPCWNKRVRKGNFWKRSFILIVFIPERERYSFSFYDNLSSGNRSAALGSEVELKAIPERKASWMDDWLVRPCWLPFCPCWKWKFSASGGSFSLTLPLSIRRTGQQKLWIFPVDCDVLWFGWCLVCISVYHHGCKGEN